MKMADIRNRIFDLTRLDSHLAAVEALAAREPLFTKAVQRIGEQVARIAELEQTNRELRTRRDDLKKQLAGAMILLNETETTGP